MNIKGQMNQNVNIFSLAILKRRNVKQNIQKETCWNFSLWAVKMSKKS